MSDTRDILFGYQGSIERLAASLSGTLGLDPPLVVSTERYEGSSWKTAEGKSGDDWIVVSDTGVDYESEATTGLEWLLTIEIRHRRRLGLEEEARCNRKALRMMAQIGRALRTRCVLLDNGQVELGRYPPGRIEDAN